MVGAFLLPTSSSSFSGREVVLELAVWATGILFQFPRARGRRAALVTDSSGVLVVWTFLLQQAVGLVVNDRV